jgi:hypothetical protein
MDLPFLSSRDRLMLVVFSLAVCLPVCWMQDVTLNEAFLLETTAQSAERADELLIRQPVLWAIDGMLLVVPFVDPILMIRLLLILALVGTVLSTAALGCEWYGRRIGLMSGAISATMVGVSIQVWHADLSIVLAILPIWLIRLFGRLDLQTGWRLQASRLKLIGKRRSLAAFVAVLAVAILVVDHQIILLSMLVPLLIAGSTRLRPMTWSALFVVVAAGPILLSLLGGMSPDQLILQGWSQLSAFSGKSQMSPAKLVEFAGVWVPMFLIGVWSTRHESLGATNSRERLLWSWALIPPVTCFFHSSLANSLVVVAGAWSILAALGLAHVWATLSNRLPQLKNESQRLARLGFTAAGILCLFSGLKETMNRDDHLDASFFAQIRQRVNGQSQLLIDPSIDMPRQAFAEFHLTDNQSRAASSVKQLIESATHADTRLRPQLFVVAAEKARGRLARLGRVNIVMQSDAKNENGSRLTLFQIGSPAIATEPQVTRPTRKL